MASLLEGKSIYVAGRLSGLTSRGIAHALSLNGGRLAPRPGPDTTHIVFAHRAPHIWVSDSGGLLLPENAPPAAALISETAFRRLIGLASPPPDEMRTYDGETLARLSEISPELLHVLSLFDLLDPVEGRFSYKDLACAREASRLLRCGFALPDLLSAALDLRASGKRLCEAKLTLTPWGGIAQDMAGSLAEADGQLLFNFEEEAVDVIGLIEAAEEHAGQSDHAGAERLYRLAMTIERDDPVLPFDLATSLVAQGRKVEARLALQLALHRAPDFADAWYNLGVMLWQDGRAGEAVGHLRRALALEPRHGEALNNLALILTEAGHHAEALALWERYVPLAADASDRARARNFALLCRLEIQSARNIDAGP